MTAPSQSRSQRTEYDIPSRVSALVNNAIFIYLEFWKGRKPMGGEDGADAKIAEIKKDLCALCATRSETETTANACWNAALDFALDQKDPFAAVDFLEVWREGAWDEIKKHYPAFQGPLPSLRTETGDKA